jgi:hypothetical protein
MRQCCTRPERLRDRDVIGARPGKLEPGPRGVDTTPGHMASYPRMSGALPEGQGVVIGEGLALPHEEGAILGSRLRTVFLQQLFSTCSLFYLLVEPFLPKMQLRGRSILDRRDKRLLTAPLLLPACRLSLTSPICWPSGVPRHGVRGPPQFSPQFCSKESLRAI